MNSQNSRNRMDQRVEWLVISYGFALVITGQVKRVSHDQTS